METRPLEIKYGNKDDERHRRRFEYLGIWIKSELYRLLNEINCDRGEMLNLLNVKPR